MAGTVLDEGLFLSSLRRRIDTSTGTTFLPKDFRAEDIAIWLNTNYTPSPLGPDALKSGLEEVMSLYPDDPSAGSPFNTGNETFGTGPGYKRGSAIRMTSHAKSIPLVLMLLAISWGRAFPSPTPVLEPNG